MSRSLFFKLFVRLVFAAAVAFGVRLLLPRAPGWLLALLMLVWCAAMALWTASSLRRILRPLQASANALVAGQQAPLETLYRDFDGLAYALASASSQVQVGLAAAAERRRELEALLDSMQDAVVAVGADGRIQWTNQRMQRLLPAWEADGRSPVRVGHALVQTVRDPDTLACVQTVLREGTVAVLRSTSLVPGRIYEVNASPMPGGGAVAVLHDVTRMEELEAAQRDFIANVSHELRTPLTSISGYVETLLDHEAGVSAMGRQFLATILKNTGRMHRLTEDLLAMARIEASNATLSPAPVRADSLVRDAVAAMQGLATEAGVTLELGELTPVQVFADADSVLQVLGNLIENAVKYGRPRDGSAARIVLSAQAVAVPWEAVEFSVRDFGQGIASEHLHRIFERFYRVDKTRSRESGGTGLGLSIARHVVQAQAGSIRAESQMGVGAVFLFTLPRALYPVPDAA